MGNWSVRGGCADALVLVVTLGVTGAVVLDPVGAPVPWRVVVGAVLVAAALSLLWRRRAPVAVAGFVVVAAVVAAAAELAVPELRPDEVVLWFPPAAPFAVYYALAVPGVRGAWVPVTALAAVVALLMLPWEESLAPLGLRSLVVVGGAALFGMYVAARRRLLVALTDRAERAEQEQHLRAQQARSDERARLAAEIHDIVAHRVSLMVLQSGALRLTTTDEATRRAAEEVRATGCQALVELRDLVAVLRDPASEGTKESRVDDHVPVPPIARLVADSASVSVAVELREEGEPGLLAPVIGRTAHRVIQEALTNVRKHAPGAHVVVEVRYRPAGVRLTVHNTAATRAADVALAAAGTGTGLLGLRHRVELVNGTFEAGPDGDGGFLVAATMPADVPTRPEVVST